MGNHRPFFALLCGRTAAAAQVHIL